MRIESPFLWLLILSLPFFACASKTLPSEKPVISEVMPRDYPAIVREPWEIEWEKTLAAARKEGKVVAAGGNAQRYLAQLFYEKYGIEFVYTVGRTSQLTPKVIAERNAGIYSLDLLFYGTSTGVPVKKLGLLQSIRAAMILADIKEEKNWYEGKFPFVDQEEKYLFSLTYDPQRPVYVNTQLVPNYKEELASYYDLLKPKWKGKIVMDDVRRGGSGLKWFGAMIEKDFGPILGIDYMKEFVRQEPMVINEDRLAAEWLMKGKYPIAMNFHITSQLLEWKSEGINVPVENFAPKEGAYITSSQNVLTFLDKAPHPNAARIFINWILSREGSILMSKVTGRQNTRIDIPEPKEIDPVINARDPRAKYANADEEKYAERTEEYARLAREIFAPLFK